MDFGFSENYLRDSPSNVTRNSLHRSSWLLGYSNSQLLESWIWERIAICTLVPGRICFLEVTIMGSFHYVISKRCCQLELISKRSLDSMLPFILTTYDIIFYISSIETMTIPSSRPRLLICMLKMRRVVYCCFIFLLYWLVLSYIEKLLEKEEEATSQPRCTSKTLVAKYIIYTVQYFTLIRFKNSTLD